MRRTAMAVMSAFAWIAPAAGAPIPWSEAEGHVGQRVTVEGRVLGVHCSPTSCLLAFDPTFDHFTVVVQAKDFKTFSPETLNADYVGHQVRVRGIVQLLERKPEIVVERPEDLRLVETAQDRANKREAALAEVMDRLDEILARFDDLTARVDATHTRLDQMTDALARQSAQLAAIEATVNAPPPVEAEPSYGRPQPRPAYEALRSIKRGMTSDEVARLVGAPLSSEGNGSGSFVWDYGYGRTITFDRRNRATSLVGFPAP